MTEWKEYSGSDEQIAEIEAAFIKNGFILLKKNGCISDVIQGNTKLVCGFVKYNFGSSWDVAKYLICNPHPNADMIRQQAMTSQPVWVKIPTIAERTDASRRTNLYFRYECTTTPNWNIPNAEYSFAPFEEEHKCAD